MEPAYTLWLCVFIGLFKYYMTLKVCKPQSLQKQRYTVNNLEPLLLTWIYLIPAWISYEIHYKMWDEITYPFPIFNDATVEGWEWISNFTHIILDMWLLMHARIKFYPRQ